MKINDIIRLVVILAVYMLLQVFWVKDFAFLNVAFCFVYIAFLIALPLEIHLSLLLILSFFLGLVIDSFYNTLGIHAAAAVALTFLRPVIIRFLTPMGGYDEELEITITSMGIRWYIIYVIVLVFLHHFILFVLEAGGFGYFYWTLAKVFASTLFSSFMIITIQFLFFTPRLRRK